MSASTGCEHRSACYSRPTLVEVERCVVSTYIMLWGLAIRRSIHVTKLGQLLLFQEWRANPQQDEVHTFARGIVLTMEIAGRIHLFTSARLPHEAHSNDDFTNALHDVSNHILPEQLQVKMTPALWARTSRPKSDHGLAAVNTQCLPENKHIATPHAERV
eukprot:4495334-Amphidinium_carterae.1